MQLPPSSDRVNFSRSDNQHAENAHFLKFSKDAPRMTPAEISKTTKAPRRVFMVISPVSLGYARFALESLFRNSTEQLHLHLITDADSDKDKLIEELTVRQDPGQHRWSVYAEDELAEREEAIFGPYPNLRLFRHGHPCWRKITDPVLLSEDEGNKQEEMVLLDPDLYFPNKFTFEPTPEKGVLLMWQKPCCLVPPQTVRSAMEQGIRFAHHVDIGVGAWRAPVDLEWMEWLLGRLGVKTLPRVMHIEAIVWSAMAMHVGGGYLHPNLWHCWYRNQPKLMLRAAGLPGIHILRVEDFSSIKCFHAGGEAKWWLSEAKQKGMLDKERDLSAPGPILPFEELLPETYYREQRVKEMLKRLGYYSVFRT